MENTANIPYDTHPVEETVQHSIHTGHLLNLVGEGYQPDKFYYKIGISHSSGCDRATLSITKISKGATKC